MTHFEYANALRRIADWIETHPDDKIGVPYETMLTYYYFAGKDELVTLARALGTCEKKFTDGFAEVRKDFGGIALRGVVERSAVCERVVTGTEEVLEEIIPARLIPAHTREIVEWKCPEALLAGGE